jgi:hypothetical protein
MSPVPWADDLAGLHFAALERLAVMRAPILYSVKLSAAAYDEQGKPVDVR